MFQSINQSKSVILGFSAMILASAVSLPAQAINLVTNGDFESGSGIGQLPQASTSFAGIANHCWLDCGKYRSFE